MTVSPIKICVSRRFLRVFLKITPERKPDGTPNNIVPIPISDTPAGVKGTGFALLYITDTHVPKEMKTAFVNIMTRRIITKFLSFKASLPWTKNYLSTGFFVATKEGGLSGLLLIKKIKGTTIALITIFKPTISPLNFS